jgi:two-component system alkaline phosphatase synthesis response regulator PhoP
MSLEKLKITVIDPDLRIHEFIRQSLRSLNAELHFFTSPRAGLEHSKVISPSLVIMDILNPEMDGVEVCAEFRSNSRLQDTLIAFFTTRNEDYSQIAGFNAGADDYILKPCRPLIFISRIKALLRRFKIRAPIKSSLNGIAIDRERYVIKKGTEEILLPRKEFELMSLLFYAPRKVFTRKEIYNEIWGGEMEVSNRTIDVHIRKLREKLGDNHIKTVKGIGYRFEK